MSTTAVAKAQEQKNIVDIVSSKVKGFVERGELQFPANYSPENAMKAAWLVLQETVDRDKKPALEVCTKASIANALLNMVVQGLNPAKKQCYFIVYGKSLQLQRSYFGSIHLAKTVNEDLQDIFAEVVYEGDVFSFRKVRGRTIIENHEQKLENINKGKIIAAYASVVYRDGSENTTIMTMADIMQAWRQSRQNPFDGDKLKADSVHCKFTAEMAKRTVINKACKYIINASDDATIVIKQAARESEDALNEAILEEDIALNANQTPLTIDSDTGEVFEAIADDEPQIDELP